MGREKHSGSVDSGVNGEHPFAFAPILQELLLAFHMVTEVAATFTLAGVRATIMIKDYQRAVFS